MPYIKGSMRGYFNVVPALAFELPGELNYAISSLVNLYIQHKGESYQVFNDVVGVLECAKLEMYRRLTSPYEDKKLKENGDVYGVK